MFHILHYLKIHADPSIIYTALTMREGISEWWTRDCDIQPIEGSHAHFNFAEAYRNIMLIKKLVKNELVEWECLEGDREWVGTNIKFMIEKGGEWTHLRFIHDGWKKETDFFGNCNYHWGHYLLSLKNYCEVGRGSPYV